MANVNSTVISGNLTRTPEVRWLADDEKSAIVSTAVAVNRRRYDKQAEDYVEEVSFIDVEVYGGFAVLVAKKLQKGDAATVQGRLDQQTWEKDGEKRSKIVLVGEQIDSEGFFRSADENNEVVVGTRESAPAAAPAAEAAPAAAPASDDIPF